MKALPSQHINHIHLRKSEGTLSESKATARRHGHRRDGYSPPPYAWPNTGGSCQVRRGFCHGWLSQNHPRSFLLPIKTFLFISLLSLTVCLSLHIESHKRDRCTFFSFQLESIVKCLIWDQFWKNKLINE